MASSAPLNSIVKEPEKPLILVRTFYKLLSGDKTKKKVLF